MKIATTLLALAFAVASVMATAIPASDLTTRSTFTCDPAATNNKGGCCESFNDTGNGVNCEFLSHLRLVMCSDLEQSLTDINLGTTNDSFTCKTPSKPACCHYAPWVVSFAFFVCV